MDGMQIAERFARDPPDVYTWRMSNLAFIQGIFSCGITVMAVEQKQEKKNEVYNYGAVENLSVASKKRLLRFL